jgi:hypothetical protein
VRTLTEIKNELDAAAERRAELWNLLGRGGAGSVSLELARLNTRIAELWDEYRTVRVRERFGAPEPILRRADRDKRLQRELDRSVEAARNSRRAA